MYRPMVVVVALFMVGCEIPVGPASNTPDGAIPTCYVWVAIDYEGNRCEPGDRATFKQVLPENDDHGGQGGGGADLPGTKCEELTYIGC